MKSIVSAVAVAATLSTSQASVFDDVNEFISTIPRTKAERFATMKIPASVHSEEDLYHIKQKAHKHTLRATEHRELLGQKMGLPKKTPYYEVLSQGVHHELHQRLKQGEEEDLTIGGAMGAIIGIFNGLQYQNNGFNPCIGTISGLMQSTENFGFLLQKIYMPWYWEDLIYNIEDFTATNGGLYDQCEVSKLFTTISGLFSLEGAMELASRAAGSIFTFLEVGNICSDPASTSLECGAILGKAFSNVIDYKV